MAVPFKSAELRQAKPDGRGDDEASRRKPRETALDSEPSRYYAEKSQRPSSTDFHLRSTVDRHLGESAAKTD
jgi:hypothetical protein